MSIRNRDKKARRSNISLANLMAASPVVEPAPEVIQPPAIETVQVVEIVKVFEHVPATVQVPVEVSAGGQIACMYEWKDRNRNGENRVGQTVHLISGGFITPATDATNPDIIVGAVTSADDGITLACPREWPGRWLKDLWGCRTGEQNPAWNPQEAYVPRTSRPEWARVAIHGVSRIRTGQPHGRNWQYIRTVTGGGPSTVEEWLLP